MSPDQMLEVVGRIDDESQAQVDIFIFFVDRESALDLIDVKSSNTKDIGINLGATLVGIIYTHNTYLTLWPNQSDRRSIVKFESN
jgi:hypothetical protein